MKPENEDLDNHTESNKKKNISSSGDFFPLGQNIWLFLLPLCPALAINSQLPLSGTLHTHTYPWHLKAHRL